MRLAPHREKKALASIADARAITGLPPLSRGVSGAVELSAVRGLRLPHMLCPPIGRQLSSARHLGASSRASIG